MRKVKVVGKHDKKCYAVKNQLKGTWSTPWGPIKGLVDTWHNFGKGRTLKTWLVFVCNCTFCKAELHVDKDFIEQKADNELYEG